MLRFARRVPGYAGLRLRDEVLSRAFLDMTFAVHFSRGSNRSICPHFVPKSLFFRRPRHPLGFTAPPAGVHRATSPQPRYSPGLGHTRPAAPSARGRATRRQPRHPPAAAPPARGRATRRHHHQRPRADYDNPSNFAIEISAKRRTCSLPSAAARRSAGKYDASPLLPMAMAAFCRKMSISRM